MKHSFVLGVAFCAATALAGTTGRRWNPNGSGNWADDSRWTFYTATSDRILLKGCTATMTEDDFDFLSKQEDLIFEDGAVLEITLSRDAIFPKTSISPTSSGKIVKKGNYQLSIGNSSAAKATRYRLPSGGIQVDAGDLYCLSGMGPITVNSPGRLIPRADLDFYCWGLFGDGVVTNSRYNANGTVKQFVFAGDASAGIPVFSGTFLNPIDLTTYNDDGTSIQYLTNPEACSSGDFRGHNGTVGVAKIGTNGGTSSLGNANSVQLSGSGSTPTTLRYLGTGETSNKLIILGNGAGIVDGGAAGSVTFTGSFRGSKASSRMSRLILTGSNTTACVIAGKIEESDSQATYVTKSGTGTWEISSTGTGHHGVVAVQEGMLRYATLAEKGVDSSLGSSDRLYQDYVGDKNVAPDEERAVPYAFLLGNGISYDSAALVPTTATLEYFGSSALACTTRLLALDGAGRVSNASAASFDFSGVTSATDKDHALVLASEGDDNVVRNVTNGVGRITVVKEGAGSWHLKDNMDVAGIEVRNGTLFVDNAASFEYFRFSAKENYSETDKAFQLGEFGMWDEDDNLRVANLVYRDCVGDATALRPGEVTDLNPFKTSGGSPSEWAPRGRTVENLFTNDVAITPSVRNLHDIIWSGNASGKRGVLNEPSTWAGFLFRIPRGKPVVRYDMRVTGGFKTDGYRELRSWSLEGSVDGLVWYPLDNVVSNVFGSTDMWVWRSSRQADHSAGNGYAIDTSSPYSTFSKPISARVDAGATLQTASSVTIDCLVFDAKAGAGIVKGLDFARTGIIEILNGSKKDVKAIPYDLSSCGNLDHVAAWLVRFNGKTETNWHVKASANGIELIPPGMVIVVR